MTSSTLTPVFALKEFFDDNTSWKLRFSTYHLPMRGPWMDYLHLLWSENRVVGEASHKPTIQGGDNGDFYPFLWRVTMLDDDQRFLKKQAFELDGATS